MRGEARASPAGTLCPAAAAQACAPGASGLARAPVVNRAGAGGWEKQTMHGGQVRGRGPDGPAAGGSGRWTTLPWPGVAGYCERNPRARRDARSAGLVFLAPEEATLRFRSFGCLLPAPLSTDTLAVTFPALRLPVAAALRISAAPSLPFRRPGTRRRLGRPIPPARPSELGAGPPGHRGRLPHGFLAAGPGTGRLARTRTRPLRTSAAGLRAGRLRAGPRWPPDLGRLPGSLRGSRV